VPGPSRHFNASSTNTTFYLNTSKATFDNAEIACQRNGGHLAAYVDFVEQYEVEQALTYAGYLIPDYHKYYWMGYTAKTWPKFYTLDKTVPFDSPQGNYTYWGYFNNSAAPVEPDGGIYGNQLCVAANYTEAYADLSGTGGGNGSVAFGWADNSCSMALSFMCRISCERAVLDQLLLGKRLGASSISYPCTDQANVATYS
jgi:hypothetical protein